MTDQAIRTPRPEIMITEYDLGAGTGAVFTGRAGGVSAAPYDTLNLGGAVGDDAVAVTENRRRVALALGLDPSRTVWMRQVHGAEVAHVGSADPGAARSGPAGSRPPADTPPAVVSPAVVAPSADVLEVDAIVTTEPGLALGVLVADCAPVLLADPHARVVGAAHSGRPGTAAGVVPALVRAMCARGADPARIRAVIGPMVCGGCYEVPAALREEVAAVVPEAFTTTRAGTPGLDLGAGIAAQLEASGVARIDRDTRCTMETAGFFSYRRDGRTGRFAGLVWLPEDA